MNEFRSAFYELNKQDLKIIKDEMKVKSIKMSMKEDFGEWVRTVKIVLK